MGNGDVSVDSIRYESVAMRRVIQKLDFDAEDMAVALGVGLLCGGIALMHLPSAMMLMGGLILVPRFKKYLPGRKGR